MSCDGVDGGERVTHLTAPRSGASGCRVQRDGGGLWLPSNSMEKEREPGLATLDDYGNVWDRFDPVNVGVGVPIGPWHRSSGSP